MERIKTNRLRLARRAIQHYLPMAGGSHTAPLNAGPGISGFVNKRPAKPRALATCLAMKLNRDGRATQRRCCIALTAEEACGSQPSRDARLFPDSSVIINGQMTLASASTASGAAS